ncbi:ubiquinone-dependent pyruvate dehydrogenase [Solirubrum puertoriconensis]|uniref:Pyruvate dehydrogenase [ubiquinone] n=1 Tax=Solirubrum puertoriconensis TaxID=1751427 RepID=A0A9X0HJK1_SOLP1|nr:ubiquinone-dependent pyruvate dehydrogenase [Solirubrum puertoriconensis]KUG07112.1 pyruvate dehydrogenase [Solirubrum puertoriconensis]
MAKKSVAEWLVDALEAAGVRRVYGVVGDSLNAFTEVIRQRGTIEWMPVRHEEAGALAAGAEAHLTGTLAVCAGSCGPGNTHLINGLFDCHRSRVPVLAIAAQIPSAEIGSGYFQETHPERLFQECSHFCELVAQAGQMPHVAETAIQTALSRGGVSVLVIPGDVAYHEIEGKELRRQPRPPAAALVPAEAEVRQAADMLNAAATVTILGGAGCAGAHAELLQVAEALQAPIVHALRGKEFIEPNNPFDVGLTGLLGQPAGYHAVKDCDLLLMLGTDFPYRQFYPDDAQVVQVDNRPEHLGRRTRIDLGLAGDVRATLQALLPHLAPKTDGRHLERARQRHQEDQQDLAEKATAEAGQAPLHPQSVVRLLDELAADDAIFTCDVGTPTVWAARYLSMNGRRRLIGSFNHGTMANAMPQALGAQLAYPERQVIALCGDGGLAMLMGDLLTLRQLNVPVKLVVLNNGSLGFVDLEMKAAGLLPFGTELHNPNFALLAEAVGLRGIRVNDGGQLHDALAVALAHQGPVLVDVHVSALELSIPPTIDPKQAVGFGLYTLKAIMSGRGNEVLDLAATNLR